MKSPHLVPEQLCYVGVAYSSLDDAIDELVSLRKYVVTHTNLRLDTTPYSDGGIHLFGDRSETPAEKAKRDYKRATYERLKKEFEGK